MFKLSKPNVVASPVFLLTSMLSFVAPRLTTPSRWTSAIAQQEMNVFVLFVALFLVLHGGCNFM